jgi:hypothetical protein
MANVLIPPFTHSPILYFKHSPYLALKWLKATIPEVFRWFSGLFPTVPVCSIPFYSGCVPGCSVLFRRHCVLFRRCSGLFRAAPEVFRAVPEVFRHVLGCSGGVPRFSALFRISVPCFSTCHLFQNPKSGSHVTSRHQGISAAGGERR